MNFNEPTSRKAHFLNTLLSLLTVITSWCTLPGVICKHL